MGYLSELSGIVSKKATSVVNRKKRSIAKIQKMGLEAYILSKIDYYEGSPALVDHFKHELQLLKEHS